MSKWRCCCVSVLAALLTAPLGCGRSAGSGESTRIGGARVEKSQAGEPLIRVLLLEAVPQFSVSVSGPYEIKQGSEVLSSGSRMRKTRVSVPPGDPPRLQVGQLVCPPGEVAVVPRRPGTLRLFAESPGRSAGHRRYDGYLKIVPRARRVVLASAAPGGAARIDAINVLGLESYLPGVLDGELYPGWHIETYRAQAVAARTYALYEMQTTGDQRDYDVRSTEASQVYLGLSAGRESKGRRAVRDTRGIVCAWSSARGDKIFCTYFSSACGGMTQPATNIFNVPQIPPLRGGVECSYCNIGGEVYRWEPVRISKVEVTQRLAARFPQYARLGEIQQISVTEATPDGRPLELRLKGRTGEVAVVDSYQFRLAMGGHRVRSNHCEIVDRGSAFEFRSGRGFGHSVGMCQWGAEGQARRGKTAPDILTFYYPESHLRRAY